VFTVSYFVEEPWPFVEKLADCEGYSDKKFGGVDYDPTNSSQVAMCKMFERMDAEDEKGGEVHFTAFQVGMGRSEKAIKYGNMYEAFQKVARITDADDTDAYITQVEWRTFWEHPEMYAASGARNTPDSTPTSSSGGVSVGVVAACTVAAVGAGIGVGYFGRGRANSATATESTAGEKESEWEKQEANEL
jgi:hypothetical protein